MEKFRLGYGIREGRVLPAHVPASFRTSLAGGEDGLRLQGPTTPLTFYIASGPAPAPTISAKIVTEVRGADFIVFRIN